MGRLSAFWFGAESEVTLLAGLAIAVGPLVLIATTRQSMTAAPITAAIVLLSTFTHASPLRPRRIASSRSRSVR